MLNPDVMVREMGVMEKCTFCVQRIRDFKDKWRDQSGFKGQSIASTGDYSRITACAAACPTSAITFGNLKDEKSDVHAQFNTNRSYSFLNELNNKPGVAYLTRVVHTGGELHHGGGHDSHDDAHKDNNHNKEHH
jgi:molybdopterin-containing oxidoreductase family iron-sulfur binding subunit